jgi:hypothetical protein
MVCGFKLTAGPEAPQSARAFRRRKYRDGALAPLGIERVKMRNGLAAIAVAFGLAASISAGQGAVLYDQGPINGGIDAWTINFDFAVTDSFTLSQASTVTGVNFGVWTLPGDTISTIDWAIAGAADNFPDQGAAVVSNSLVCGGCGFDVYDISWDSFSIPGQQLAAGAYWLVLQNAAVTNGDPAYWDENDGLSLAFENTVGQIGSGSFQILGTVPEPSTWTTMLIGFAGIGFAGRQRARALANVREQDRRCWGRS